MHQQHLILDSFQYSSNACAHNKTFQAAISEADTQTKSEAYREAYTKTKSPAFNETHQ